MSLKKNMHLKKRLLQINPLVHLLKKQNALNGQNGRNQRAQSGLLQVEVQEHQNHQDFRLEIFFLDWVALD